jgi:hypothetical protein
MNAYVLTSQVYITEEFRNVAGSLTNPPNLSLHIARQDGVVDIVAPSNGVDGVVDTSQTGRWFATYTTVVEGEHGWTWYSGTAAIQGAQGQFLVKRARAA